MALLRIGDLLRTRFAQVVAPEDLTLQQYNVLRILRGAGREGLPTLEIAERMIERSPGVTRLADRLEAKRLIERERSAEDRRTVTCRITRRGRRVLAVLDGPMDRADTEAMAMLGSRERRTLVGLLNRVLEGLE